VGLVDDTAVGNKWIIHSTGDGNESGERYHHGTVAVPEPRRRLLWAAAVVWTWATTSFVTDYVAPVIIGLAPAVYAGFQLARQHSPDLVATEQGAPLPPDFPAQHSAPVRTPK